MPTNYAKHAKDAGLISSTTSKVAKAVALYMRPSGATAADVAKACGGPQLNVWRNAKAAGHAATQELDGKGRKVYKIKLSGGAKRVVREAKASTKTKAKAKRTRKASTKATASTDTQA